MLKIFYGTIVVENADLIPKTGQPWSVPSQARIPPSTKRFRDSALSAPTIPIP